MEDDDLVRGMTVDALQTIGYTPLVAASPQHAVELCSAPEGEDIRLMLTDIVMPGMNGDQLWDLVCGRRWQSSGTEFEISCVSRIREASP